MKIRSMLDEGLLRINKVSKYQKQILNFSFEQKTNEHIFCISAQALQNGSSKKNEMQIIILDDK